MAKAKKFGAFGGVFTPSILTILGVIMYLRLPWIVGQAGLLATLGIILVAHIISGSTGLSVASIATDKRVETGGTYYIISRSLGLPIGGTLGWALFVGLSFSVSLYLIGFAEVFLGYFGFEVNLTTIRIAGSIILLLVTILTFISTSLAIKTQYIILAAMVLSLISVFFGSHEFTPEQPQLNTIPESLPWIALFAIFFPAVTGFEAGVSMSGDLKDPRKSIPLGTILAILVGLIVYVGLAFFFSYTVNRDLLVNDPNVLFKISLVKQLVIAGILGATLSSALGSILGAPRIMQAVAKDRIAPFFLSKGFGPSNEPRNALLLTFVIAQAGILIGELNVIARIVTIFFIITYGFLNVTYTIESWASSDFRPAFKIPRFVSIIGAAACIIVMIQLDILAMAAASIVLLAIFFYLKNKELNLQSGDTRSSIWLSLVKTGLTKLTKSQTNTRNWRPNVIIFSGGTQNRPHLIEIGKAIVGKLGIFTNFELIEQPDENLLFEKTAKVSSETVGEYENILTRRHVCKNIYDGIEMISRVYGFSGFEPNTILMGWARNARNPKRMEELLINLKKLNYNLTFLKYDKNKGFGKHKKIDFWWSGKGRNLPLALHLIRFITATPKWRHAQIRILVINSNSRNTERYYTLLGQILDNYRIRADVKIINSLGKINQEEIIRSESYNSDLTIAELPAMDSKNAEKIIKFTNELTESLKTCLLIDASSNFEEVNVISEIPSNGKEKPSDIFDRKPVVSIIKDIQLSETDIIHNQVHNLAQLLEKQTEKLFDNTLLPIPEKYKTYLDHLESLSDKTFEKLLSTDKIKNQQEKQWEYLKILNDYSYQVHKQLTGFKDNYLNYEKEIFLHGFSAYISETEKTISTLPRYIRLMFGLEDFKKLKPEKLLKKLNRARIILWLSLYGKKVSYKINTQPAARYFLYYKRLVYCRQFFEEHTIHSLANFSLVRECYSEIYEMVEKARSGKLSPDELKTEKEKTSKIIIQLKNENQNFIYSQSNKLVQELSQDLESFSKVIESPRANSLSRKFKPLNKKIGVLENILSELPSERFSFLNNHVNKTYLDFIYLALKSRISTKTEKTYQDIKILIETDIHKKLKQFENQILSFLEKIDSDKEKKKWINHKSISEPRLGEMFDNLIKEIHELVEELPETIEIATEGPKETSGFEKPDNIGLYIVSVRKTADFYISNELSDQIKKESLSLEHQLSLSIAAIKDLIRLANFNLENGENNNIGESDLATKKEQQISLIENILTNIRNEDKKLRKFTEEVRTGFCTGIKNAFEPLSSSVIIRTSGSLNKKIKETDKRIFSNRLRKLKKTFSNKILNQFVNLLYRRSEGHLWARRIEQLKENSLVYPGETVNEMLEMISPRKEVMQHLPFYYANLFSGSSSIGEDFWVGMEDEIEKGSRAIKRFIHGAAGTLIISGERSSGKSSLSKHLASLHFDKQNIFSIRAPRESIADKNLFRQTLLKNLNGNEDLEYSMEMLPPKTVIIINDLELWWERKPFGTQVVEEIINLLRRYGHKVLFIININMFALKVINQLSSLNTWALDIVICQAFDARKLRSLIMLRHQAGGMKFIINKRNENEMTGWDYARLFNRYFNLSFGNPGYALNLWLAGIQKISGNLLYINKPYDKSILIPETIPQEELIIILQFILHRRFSVRSLSEILQNDFETTERTIRILVQKGILIEKFPEVYSLNPALEIHLAKKLKSLELL